MQFYLSDYELVKDQCQQYTGDPEIMEKLVFQTNGDVCKTGCPWYRGAKCAGYKQLRLLKKNKRPPGGTTNSAISQKLGVSKRQVAKLRKQGLLSKIEI